MDNLTPLSQPVPVRWRTGRNDVEGHAIAVSQRGMVTVKQDEAESTIPINLITVWGGLTIGQSVRIKSEGKEGAQFNGQTSKKWRLTVCGYGTHKGEVSALVQIGGGTFPYRLCELTPDDSAEAQANTSGSAAEVSAIEKSYTAADATDIATEVERINAELNETEATFVSAGKATLSLYKLLGEKLTIARESDAGKYGKWAKWLEDRGIQSRKANRAMQLHRDWAKLEAIAQDKSVTLSDFTLTDALNALAQKRPELPQEELLERGDIEKMFEPWGTFTTNSGDNARFYPWMLDRPGSPKFFRSLRQAVEWREVHCHDGNRLDAPQRESAGISGAASFAPNPARVAQLNAQLNQQLSEQFSPTETAAAAKTMPDFSSAAITINGALVTGAEVAEEDGADSDSAQSLEPTETTDEHPAGILAQSGNDDQYSPEKVWGPGLECFGVERFGLDPASHAGSAIPCERIFTIEDDGLIQDWTCSTLWMNHPYSKNEQFLKKFLAEYDRGVIGQALILTKTDNRVAWYQELLQRLVPFCLVETGLKFINEANKGNGSFFGSTVFYFGPHVDRFYRAYSTIGTVCQALHPEMFGE